MEKIDYRWMTKVAIHLIDNVEEFIIQYKIPQSDIDVVKELWDKAKQDWENFEQYANDNTINKTIPIVKKESVQKCRGARIKNRLKYVETNVIDNLEKKDFKKRYGNARLVNRINKYQFLQETEEELIDKYIDELNYQKVKKLADLISFYEDEELNIAPNLSIA